MNARSCGDCTLCCTLIPVEEIGKPANQRCRFQGFGCCTIYAQRPASCRLWNCRWLVNDDADDLPRPDAAGYVIDVLPDIIRMRFGDDEPIIIETVQVWCDPAKRDSWRTPEMLGWIERRAKNGIATLIRFNSRDGIAVFAPPLASDGQWHEKASNYAPELLGERKKIHGY